MPENTPFLQVEGIIAVVFVRLEYQFEGEWPGRGIFGLRSLLKISIPDFDRYGLTRGSRMGILGHFRVISGHFRGIWGHFSPDFRYPVL